MRRKRTRIIDLITVEVAECNDVEKKIYFTPWKRTSNIFLAIKEENGQWIGEIQVCRVIDRVYYKLPKPVTKEEYHQYISENKDKILSEIYKYFNEEAKKIITERTGIPYTIEKPDTADV